MAERAESFAERAFLVVLHGVNLVLKYRVWKGPGLNLPIDALFLSSKGVVRWGETCPTLPVVVEYFAVASDGLLCSFLNLEESFAYLLMGELIALDFGVVAVLALGEGMLAVASDPRPERGLPEVVSVVPGLFLLASVVLSLPGFAGSLYCGRWWGRRKRSGRTGWVR